MVVSHDNPEALKTRFLVHLMAGIGPFGSGGLIEYRGVDSSFSFAVVASTDPMGNDPDYFNEKI